MHDDTGRRLYQGCSETCEVLLVAILTTVALGWKFSM